VNNVKKLIIAVILILLLSNLALAQDETAVVRQLNERLERNKAELLKEIKDNQAKTESAIGKSVDDNFAVLDGNIKNMLKNQSRDVAVIMVAGFVGAFALSQILRYQIEKMKRKALLKDGYKMEMRVNELQIKATKLMQTVRKLDQMEKNINKRIGEHKRAISPQRFLNPRTIAFGLATFLIGVVITVVVT
jgi:hypothetical protein